MTTAIKWTAVIVAAWLGFRWLSGVYDKGSANLASDGETVMGRGWAPPLIFRNRVYAWAPPYGKPHEGGAA